MYVFSLKQKKEKNLTCIDLITSYMEDKLSQCTYVPYNPIIINVYFTEKKKCLNDVWIVCGL